MERFTLAKYFITFIFVALINTFAQESNPIDFCGTTELEYDKLHIPTSTPIDGQYLRALFIFVTFSDDNLNGDGHCIWENSSGHPEGTRPLNPHTVNHNLVALAEESNSIPHMERYEQYTISDYFCQMSLGQFDLIGDEVYFQLPYTSEYYQNTLNWRRPQLNQYILQYVNDNFPNINFQNYDNWHKEGNNWVWGGDGETEMIVIQFRRIPTPYEAYYWYPNGTPGGIANLGLSSEYITKEGIHITNDDGITATQGMCRTTTLELVLEHEISHHIFGSEFNHFGFNPWHVSIGMMTEGYSISTYCMTPMERSMNGKLDWLVPYTANGSNNLYSFALRDEFEYGDAVKV
jgi:hypothetical protein